MQIDWQQVKHIWDAVIGNLGFALWLGFILEQTHFSMKTQIQNPGAVREKLWQWQKQPELVDYWQQFHLR